MEVDIIKIGNSKGIRIPSNILKKCGFGKKVVIEVNGNSITLTPARKSREGWAEACKRMHANGDDTLLIPSDLDNDMLEEWDDN